MTAEMRKTLAKLPYPEKLRRVAELIDLSRRLKAAKKFQASAGGPAVKNC